MNNFRFSCILGENSLSTFRWELFGKSMTETHSSVGRVCRVERTGELRKPPTALSFPQGNILEKMNICSSPHFFRFVQDSSVSKKNLGVFVKDLLFGTIPVRLFQPKGASSKPGRGIIFLHGGGAFLGSLGEDDPCSKKVQPPQAHPLFHENPYGGSQSK